MQKRLHATVYGDVQGVFFRRFACTLAQERSIVGFARNLPDGTVEVVAEGEEGKLQELLAGLRERYKTARVERVAEVWGNATGEWTEFKVL